MVKMRNIKVLEKDEISMDCEDENYKKFHLVFKPSELEIIQCNREKDVYVFQAMYRVAKEYEEGSLKEHSIAMWY